MFSVETLWVFENTFSLAGGIVTLFENGEWPLGIIVIGFSVLFPFGKIIAAGLAYRMKQQHDLLGYQKAVHWLHVFGKWSMLDVFVVAILVASIKLSIMANIEVHMGIYVFATAVLMTIFNVWWLENRT